MANKPLDQSAISALLAPSKAKKASPLRPHPPQNGPLRWVDQEGRCSSRGCNSPTYTKVSGIYYCGSHSLVELNRMLVKLSVEAKVCPLCSRTWFNAHIGTTDKGDIEFDKEQMAYVHKNCGGIIAKREG